MGSHWIRLFGLRHFSIITIIVPAAQTAVQATTAKYPIECAALPPVHISASAGNAKTSWCRSLVSTIAINANVGIYRSRVQPGSL